MRQYIPYGWESAFVVSDREGLCGSSVEVLSDGEIFVCWAITNDGPSPIEGRFQVDMYLDGVVVQRWLGSDMPVRGFIFMDSWSNLLSRVRLQPGKHTLRIVADSTKLIPETNESDNVLEQDFIWEPASSAATPVPSRLSDLAPYIPEGWDDPIIATSYFGDTIEGPLSLSATTYIRYGIENRGLTSTPSDIWVYLYLDDILVDMRALDGLIADGTVPQPEWAGLLEATNVTQGEHVLKLVIDPNDLVLESDETNNTFEKRFTWDADAVPSKLAATTTPGPTPPLPLTLPNLVPGWRFGWDGPIIVSHEEGTYIDALLTVDKRPLIDLVVKNQSTIEATAFTVDLYFDGEKVNITLLNREDYLAWIDDDFAEKFATRDESAYASLLASREWIKTRSLGFKTRRFSKVAVVVDAERRAADVIDSLAHELGHMRQDYLNPDQTEAEQYHFLNAIQEAEAQQFQRAFWLAIEGFSGLSLLTYPDYAVFHTVIDHRLDSWVRDAPRNEHSLGYLLQWLAVMDDSKLIGLRDELAVNGRLSTESALELYDYFVSLAPESIQAYVAERVRGLSLRLSTISMISKSRLIDGLNPDDEGAPELRIDGLLAP